MDTLTIVREIIDLAAERDSLLEQLHHAQASVTTLRADLHSSASHNLTLSDLCDEQRAAIERLRAELDAARSSSPASTTEPAVMTREQILSVAREALATGRQVRVTFSTPEVGDGSTNLNVIQMDNSSMPICLSGRPPGACGWCYLTCELTAEEYDKIEGIEALELL